MATIDVRHLHIGGNPAFPHGKAVASRRGRITLVIGGERSGKSTYAEDYALEAAGDGCRYFIATAKDGDDEMSRRILCHQSSREGLFVAINEPTKLADALRGLPCSCEVCIIDSLTVWVCNLIRQDALDGKVDELLDALVSSQCDLILVTNEVGLGFPPQDAYSQSVVQEVGKLNQKLASLADNVVVMVSGLPFALKGNVL